MERGCPVRKMLSMEWKKKSGSGGISIETSKNGYSGIFQVAEPSVLEFSFDEKQADMSRLFIDGIQKEVRLFRNKFVLCIPT